jgi:hypothetical protein
MLHSLLLTHIIVFGATLVLSSLECAASYQANFTVNDTRDLRDADLSDQNCLTREQTCTLRAAIQQANVLGGGHTIDLPAGVHRLTIVGGFEDNAARGDLDVLANLTIRGASARRTMILGQADDRVFDIRPGASALISGVTIQGGFVDGDGGGIENLGSLVLMRSTVTGNYAVGDGGGVYSTGMLRIMSSTISGNTADNSGGGISSIGQMVITNSTIGENGVSPFGAQKGGGMRNVGSGAMARLLNVTFHRNSAQEGAAISNDSGGQVTVKMTILSSITGDNCLGPVISAGHNLDNGSTCALAGSGDLSNVDPQLGQLGSNGGPTDTYALMASSPAIDAGDNVGCPLVDQRGMPRPQDSDGDGTPVCEIGAFEAATP